jgi:hypothetical protein
MPSLFMRFQRVASSFRVRPRTWVKIFLCFGRRYISYFQGEPGVFVAALTHTWRQVSVGRWPIRLSIFHTPPAIISVPYESPDNRRFNHLEDGNCYACQNVGIYDPLRGPTPNANLGTRIVFLLRFFSS